MSILPDALPMVPGARCTCRASEPGRRCRIHYPRGRRWCRGSCGTAIPFERWRARCQACLAALREDVRVYAEELRGWRALLGREARSVLDDAVSAEPAGYRTTLDHYPEHVGPEHLIRSAAAHGFDIRRPLEREADRRAARRPARAA